LVAGWLWSATCTCATFARLVAAWPAISAPTAEFGLLPSHQSHVSCWVPMSVALWTAAMPPPFCMYLMIAARWAASHSGPGGPADAFSSTMPS
jgi:hypothetical protein